MGLTVDNLLAAVAVVAGETASRPADIADLVHRAEPPLAPTLFSAWETEGVELTPAWRGELDTARRRLEFYRVARERIRAKVPGLTTVKGLEVADLYPAGFIRNMSDLDLIAPDEADQWQAASFLLQDGWDLDTATFTQISGTMHVMVSLRRPHEDHDEPPYGVEITTYYAAGNQGGIPPVLSLPEQWRAPAVKNTLMLLHERYEQPFRARDLIDASLLHASLRDGESDTLLRAVVALGLAPEYAELARLVGKAGLGALPALPGGRRTMAMVRARRIARSASFLARPLAGTGRHLQRHRITGDVGLVERRAWAAVQRLLHPVPAARAGLLAFGLPLDGPPPDVASAVLFRRGPLAWADTPIARFVLTIGDDVSQAAVDELSAGDGTGAAGAGAAVEASR